MTPGGGGWGGAAEHKVVATVLGVGQGGHPSDLRSLFIFAAVSLEIVFCGEAILDSMIVFRSSKIPIKIGILFSFDSFGDLAAWFSWEEIRSSP